MHLWIIIIIILLIALILFLVFGGDAEDVSEAVKHAYYKATGQC